MAGRRSKTRFKTPVKKAKRKRIGKSPNPWRKDRAVGLREVRKAFSCQDLDRMGQEAREALREVRAQEGGVLDTSYIFKAAGATYKINADELALRDFLWRIGEQETVDG